MKSDKTKPSTIQQVRKLQWGEVVKFVSRVEQQDSDDIEFDYEAKTGTISDKIEHQENQSNHIEHFIIRSSFKKEFNLLAKQANFDLSKDIQLSFEGPKNRQKLLEYMRRLGSNVDDICFSSDYRFVLKKLPSGQHKTFKEQLGDIAFKGIFANNNSLTLKSLGLYEIQHAPMQAENVIQLFSSSFYILMENILSTWNFQQNQLLAIYDLKGSNIGRTFESSSDSDDEAIKKKKNKENSENQIVFGKDNDFQNNIQHVDIIMSLPSEIKAEMIKSLQEETKQFQKINIMDYSVLLALGKRVEGSEHTPIEKAYKFRNIQLDTYVVSFGIIDYLSTYDIGRVLENTLKSIFCSEKDKISCVQPQAYQERLYKYMQDNILNLKS